MRGKTLAELVLTGTLLMVPQAISNSSGDNPKSMYIMAETPILSPIKRAGLDIYGENQKTLGTDFFKFYRLVFSDIIDTANPIGITGLQDKTKEEIKEGMILRNSLEARYNQFAELMSLDSTADIEWKLLTAYSNIPIGAYRRTTHEAIDIFTQEGNEVIAPFDGIIVASGDGWDGMFYKRNIRTWNGKGLTPRAGNAVIIFNPYEKGYMLISHMQEGIEVEAGDIVAKGQVIGYVGHSGSASIKGHGEHIHVAYKLQDKNGSLRGIDFSERLK